MIQQGRKQYYRLERYGFFLSLCDTHILGCVCQGCVILIFLSITLLCINEVKQGSMNRHLKQVLSVYVVRGVHDQSGCMIFNSTLHLIGILLNIEGSRREWCISLYIMLEIHLVHS